MRSYRIHNSSFAKSFLTLRYLAKNPGTKDRPIYVHAGYIGLEGNKVTLIANGEAFTFEREMKCSNPPLFINKLGVAQNNKIKYCFFDVQDKNGKYLKIWVTCEEMNNTYLKE